MYTGQSGCQKDVHTARLDSLSLECNDDEHREDPIRSPAAGVAQSVTAAAVTHQWSRCSRHACLNLFCCPLTQVWSNISINLLGVVHCLSHAGQAAKSVCLQGTLP